MNEKLINLTPPKKKRNSKEEIEHKTTKRKLIWKGDQDINEWRWDRRDEREREEEGERERQSERERHRYRERGGKVEEIGREKEDMERDIRREREREIDREFEREMAREREKREMEEKEKSDREREKMELLTFRLKDKIRAEFLAEQNTLYLPSVFGQKR